MKFGKIGLTCVSLFLLSAVSIAALAQGAGQPGAPGGGGRQGGGQRGRQGTPLVTVPVSVMDSYLKLTADQKAKIAAIQTQYKADVKDLVPAQGAQPDPQAMQEMFQKRQAASTKADADIKAVLTDTQTPMVADMTKDLQSYNAVGIPVGVLGDLKLTADQKTKLAAIATDSQKEMQAKRQEAQANGARLDRQTMQDMQKATSEKAMAVLTTSQKTTLDAYVKTHPQPQFGGGGRRPGGAAGAPPPAH
ncbi:MAG: hypothetical protein JWL77_6754 [Chthonomonadaceae bacterium]|nr:hypothetical protein [Chthonomonadaceae bacterium]